jgi:hypothetical protein
MHGMGARGTAKSSEHSHPAWSEASEGFSVESGADPAALATLENTRIAGRQDQNQRQPTTVEQCMGPGCQATSGTTNGVIDRIVTATQ